MPPSRTPLIFPELPREQPVVRRGDRAIRCRGSARNRSCDRASKAAGLGRRGSTSIARSRVRLADGDDRCRRPRYHPPTTAGVRRGAASPMRHLSPRSVPLPMPLTRGAHSHKSAHVRALAASGSERDSLCVPHALLCLVVFL